MAVLDFFSWYVRFPTAAHYTHYYLKAALTQEDIDNTIKSSYTLFYQIHHHVLNYLNEVLYSELLQRNQLLSLCIKKTIL